MRLSTNSCSSKDINSPPYRFLELDPGARSIPRDEVARAEKFIDPGCLMVNETPWRLKLKARGIGVTVQRKRGSWVYPMDSVSSLVANGKLRRTVAMYLLTVPKVLLARASTSDRPPAARVVPSPFLTASPCTALSSSVANTSNLRVILAQVTPGGRSGAESQYLRAHPKRQQPTTRPRLFLPVACELPLTRWVFIRWCAWPSELGSTALVRRQGPLFGYLLIGASPSTADSHFRQCITYST